MVTEAAWSRCANTWCTLSVPLLATDTYSKYTSLFLRSLPTQAKCSSLEVREVVQSPRIAPQHFFPNTPPAGAWCRAVRSLHC